MSRDNKYYSLVLKAADLLKSFHKIKSCKHCGEKMLP